MNISFWKSMEKEEEEKKAQLELSNKINNTLTECLQLIERVYQMCWISGPDSATDLLGKIQHQGDGRLHFPMSRTSHFQQARGPWKVDVGEGGWPGY